MILRGDDYGKSQAIPGISRGGEPYGHRGTDSNSTWLVRVRNYLKQSLNQTQRGKLAKIQALRFRGLQHLCYRLFIGSNLKTLAIVNKSDKWGSHWYAQHYEHHFASLR